MRAVLHAEPRLVAVALEAVRDVLVAERLAGGGSDGKRRGRWRGTVSRRDSALALEATHRTATLRRRLRLEAPAAPFGLDPSAGDGISALAAIAELLEKARPPVADHEDRVTAALLQEPALAGWSDAAVEPGAPWGPARVAAVMEDGTRRFWSAEPGGRWEPMPEELAGALTDDAFHVHAFEIGNELRVRIGSGEPLRVVKPWGLEALRIVRRAAEDPEASDTAGPEPLRQAD